MASFARAGFDVAGYLASRPTYPQKLYDLILAFHKLNGGRFDHALDVGCGPGFMALNLAQKFKQVTAIDPAEKMVKIGLQPEDPSAPRIRYAVGSAEDLGKVGIGQGEEGVDLVVAGQAAHWFDHPTVWAQLAKHLRPGGTVAYVGYGEMCFPTYPSLNHLITTHASSPSALGPYWPQPGRSIVEGLLDRVPFPVVPTSSTNLPGSTLESLPSLESGYPVLAEIQEPPPTSDSDVVWDPNTAVRFKSASDGQKWFLRKKFNVSSLEGYLRTFSSLHEYHLAHPEDLARKGKGKREVDGDIVDRLLGQLVKGLEEEGWDSKGEVEVGWPLVLLMIKKKL